MAERIPNPIPVEEQSESVIDTLFNHYFETRKNDAPEVDTAYRVFCHKSVRRVISEISGKARFSSVKETCPSRLINSVICCLRCCM